MKVRTQLANLIVLTTILISHTLAQSSPADPSKAAGAQSAQNIDQSIDTILGDHTWVHQLVTDLQQAVAKHDAAAVAALIHYPIKVKLHGKPTYLKDEQAFIKNTTASSPLISPAQPSSRTRSTKTSSSPTREPCSAKAKYGSPATASPTPAKTPTSKSVPSKPTPTPVEGHPPNYKIRGSHKSGYLQGSYRPV